MSIKKQHTMKYILIIILGIFCYNCKAQNPVLPLDDWDEEQTNAYYKDLDNELNGFVGTWLYTEGNTSLKIVLKKEVMHFNGRYYEDLIVGEYQYIKNGVEKINTLANLNTVLGYQHKINGNSIFKDCIFLPASDCTDGETRLDVNLSDPITEHPSNTLLHKRIVNGQQALRMRWSFNYFENNPPDPNMPWKGEWLLIKQD